MYILGISGYSHESSAALLKDGQVQVLLEEERLNREKHTWKYPRNAIEQCLRSENLTIKDIDKITFFWQPGREISENFQHVARHFPESLNLLRSGSGSDELSFSSRVKSMVNIGKEIQKQFQLSKPPQVYFCEHHLAHAASAFFVSPFEEAAILTMDGRGEAASTLLSRGRGNKIEKILEIKVPHSLGHLYAAVTDYLGFTPFFDEWKVMGMSAYGKGSYDEVFDEMVHLLDNGEYRLNLKYFQFHTHGRAQWVSKEFLKKLGPKRKRSDSYDQRHFDIAHGLQKVIEKAGVHLARHLHKVTASPNLCMTGGVVLNCLMNKKIVEETLFKDFFIQPVANDAGTSMGSALYYHHQVMGSPRKYRFKSPYLGLEYSAEEIERSLKEHSLKYSQVNNIAAETARHIAQGKIVGWFQGKMEAGPRALGNRSIVADPRDPLMKDRLNARVKRREYFRPFAPSVLEEKTLEYFLMPKGQMSPYMILVGDVRPEKQALIPAVTHADGTARVHTVSRKTNPRYWELISEFEKLTGVPVILNTSFNENEPVVCMPEDAIRCFLRTEFDVLAIGNFLVTKN